MTPVGIDEDYFDGSFMGPILNICSNPQLELEVMDLQRCSLSCERWTHSLSWTCSPSCTPSWLTTALSSGGFDKGFIVFEFISFVSDLVTFLGRGRGCLFCALVADLLVK